MNHASARTMLLMTLAVAFGLPPSVADAAAGDLSGVWRSINDAPDPFVQIAFDRAGEGEEAKWTARLTIPAAMLMDRPLADAVIEGGRRFSGSTEIAGFTITVRGALADRGSGIEGFVEFTRAGNSQSVPLRLVPTRVATTVPGATRYAAELEAMGMKLPMAMTLADAGEIGWVGTIDIPSQQMTGLPVIVERSHDGVFTVALPVGVRAVMTLSSAADGAVLEGTFVQGPVSAPIRFQRSDAPVRGASRPQDPKPPFPYREVEVSVPTPEGHTLAGTLTIPDSATSGRVPGVVMLTGSGLQDRDEAIMGHRPFLVIADALARGGIAVLRCDDRGFGRSTGDPTNATTRDFAKDGRAMMAFLRSRPEVDPSRCGYVGHSEGGLTGPLAALEDQAAEAPVAFVVLLAGTAVPGLDILRVQSRRVFEGQGVPVDEAEAIALANEKVLRAILDDADRQEIRAQIAALIRLQQGAIARRAGVEPPEVGEDSPQVEAALAAASSAWMREFLVLDPAPVLRSLEAPILALNGDLDTQVDAQQNLLRIEAIRREAGRPVTIRRYPNLNHLFQPAVTGGVEEYGVIETTIDPIVLEELVRWIRETTASTTPRP